MFTSEPLCEVCGRETATAFVGFRIGSDPKVGRWQFTCGRERDAAESESFSIAEFFSSPQAMVDQLAHLQESSRIDWKPFMDMLVRLRAATSPPAPE